MEVLFKERVIWPEGQTEFYVPHNPEMWYLPGVRGVVAVVQYLGEGDLPESFIEYARDTGWGYCAPEKKFYPI